MKKILFLCVISGFSIFLSAAGEKQLPPLLKGPYLQFNQKPSKGTIVICWETRDQTEGIVEYSVKGNEKEKEKTSDGKKDTRHEVSIAGLKPGTTYTYRISGGVSEDGSFSIPAPDKEKFRFVAIGDPREYDKTTEKLVKLIIEEKPDFVIGTGDYVSTGQSKIAWQDCFTMFHDLFKNVPFFPSLGDHDLSDEGRGAEDYCNYFVLPGDELDYTFNWGKSHFIAIDITWDSICKPSTKQYQWLEKDLEISKNSDFVFMYYHLPAYTAGAHRQIDTLKRAQRLFPLYTRLGGDFSFAGHDHNYQHWQAEEITHIVTGGLTQEILYDINEKEKAYWENKGYLKKAVKKPSYVVVDITPEKAIFSAKGLDGVFEKFEIPKKPLPRETGNLKDGKKEGVWSTYYQNDKILAEITYKNGVKDGKYTCYYQRGQKWEEGLYNNGLVEGKWSSWYPDGKLKEECYYTAGKLNGEQWYYNLSGKKQELQIFKDNMEDGEWIDYKEDGGIAGKYKFKDGEKIK
ncbi:MAG: hypothetical protein A2231_09145 [Candidatus Firestonebacteria bacterium RIFOXYA2_FULL_40_8]|nr:MAG: hypothetical protein A2231_09145 [Candidatus Firestonebacteria bacterium RIFOXYA2_FULL_40_8]